MANDMQMEGEGGREEGERKMCCWEEIHSAEEKRQTASMSICLLSLIQVLKAHQELSPLENSVADFTFVNSAKIEI